MNSPEPLIRRIGQVIAEDGDIEIEVDQVFSGDGDDIGLTMTDAGTRQSVSAVLTHAQALRLANRLERAVNVSLEHLEDLPDIEREMERYGAPEQEKR